MAPAYTLKWDEQDGIGIASEHVATATSSRTSGRPPPGPSSIPSLVVKLPISIKFVGHRAIMLPPPPASTFLSSHPLGPPPSVVAAHRTPHPLPARPPTAPAEREKQRVVSRPLRANDTRDNNTAISASLPTTMPPSAQTMEQPLEVAPPEMATCCDGHVTKRRMSNRAPPVAEERPSKKPKKEARSENISKTELLTTHLLSETIAKGVPKRQTETTAAETATAEDFATKWLPKLHSYIRSWSEDADPRHAAKGFQLLVDFNGDAALNNLKSTTVFASRQEIEVPASQKSGIGTTRFVKYTDAPIDVLSSQENRNYTYSHPFVAAAAVNKLNRKSIRIWNNVIRNGGIVRGQSVATMGVTTKQEILRLLERA